MKVDTNLIFSSSSWSSLCLTLHNHWSSLTEGQPAQATVTLGDSLVFRLVTRCDMALQTRQYVTLCQPGPYSLHAIMTPWGVTRPYGSHTALANSIFTSNTTQQPCGDAVALKARITGQQESPGSKISASVKSIVLLPDIVIAQDSRYFLEILIEIRVLPHYGGK